jgi:hypothetical protein
MTQLITFLGLSVLLPSMLWTQPDMIAISMCIRGLFTHSYLDNNHTSKKSVGVLLSTIIFK